MAYEMVMPYHLHMPSYFLETFTEYPYSSGKPLYRISRNQFIGRNKTGATTHGAGFTNIEAGFMKQVLYLPVVCGEINLSSRLDIQFYRLQHVFRT